MNWCVTAVAFLRAMRSGDPTNNHVEGIKLVERVTHVGDTKTLCYHLTSRARELLRKGGALPWGA